MISIELARPWLLLIMIPALILGIVPFFRLHKNRRMSLKHLIPFIIHLALVLLVTSLLSGIVVTRTSPAPTESTVIFVADMSASNESMKDEMNEFVQEIINTTEDLDNTHFGMVIFSNGAIRVIEPGDFDIESEDFLFYATEEGEEPDLSETNIATALDAAAELFPEDTLFVRHRQNKRIVLMSDGDQTMGNAYTKARELHDDNIRLDAAYFSLSESTKKEVQLISITTNGKIEVGGEVNVSVMLKSTSYIPRATLTIIDGDVEITRDIVVQKGTTTVDVAYEPNDVGINTIQASLSVEDDLIEQNNTLYSWYTLDAEGHILIVDGDGRQTEQLENSAISFGDYHVTVVRTSHFPQTLEEMLEYDEIILMNVDFSKEGTGGELPRNFDENIKRYVEEIGRGVLVTGGSNMYDAENDIFVDSPLNELLPVHLHIDDEMENVGVVITIDLSSSMKEQMGYLMDENAEFVLNEDGSKIPVSRFTVAVEAVRRTILNADLQPHDYIGVVAFDQDSHIALDLQELGDEANRALLADTAVYNLNHYFYAYYETATGEVTNIPVNANDGDRYTSQGYKYPAVCNQTDGKTTGGDDKCNGNRIKTYGTSYKWAFQEASNMLTGSREALEIKQVIFMSDGAPNDQGSGYEGIVKLLAKGGTATNTIAIGTTDAACISELEALAVLGGGDLHDVFDMSQMSEKIYGIVESQKGGYMNEDHPFVPVQTTSNNSILEDVSAEYETIYGYYGTSIKEGADLVLYVDNVRPLYADWEFGLGKVAVFMTDLGNPTWTSTYFDNSRTSSVILLENIFLSCIEGRVDSTGLSYEVDRTESNIRVDVKTYAEVRDTEFLEAVVTRPDGTEEIVNLSRTGRNKYSVDIPVQDQSETYVINVQLKQTFPRQVHDRLTFAVTGYYKEEYDIFNVGDPDADGRATMNGISANGGGGLVTNTDTFYDIVVEESVQENIDVSTPMAIVALVMFIIDLLFRNFAKRRKKKKEQMTDEEQIASMRGR